MSHYAFTVCLVTRPCFFPGSFSQNLSDTGSPAAGIDFEFTRAREIARSPGQDMTSAKCRYHRVAINRSYYPKFLL